MPTIVFGSVEANAIVLKDKEAARWEKIDEEEEAKLVEGAIGDLRARLKRIDGEIGGLEMRLSALEDDRSNVQQKLKRLEADSPKMTIAEWNAWATGSTLKQ